MPFFALTIFISAFLLFQVQPLIARFILPWFGGAPAVWTSCMLFFQIVLLLGYLYADRVTRWFSPRGQVWLHTGLAGLAILLLPIIPAESWKPAGDESPTLRILLLLTVTIGLPYFLLSTTGPLVQAWFARRFPGRSPYRLFALSNFGSLLALISYPLVFEPLLATRYQAFFWTIGFVGFAFLVVATGWYSLRETKPGSGLANNRQDSAAESPPPGGGDPNRSAELPAIAKSDRAENERPETLGRLNLGLPLAWVALATIPSILLLATTNQICQEVAVVPFLWVLPLSLYLISFIFCFDKPHWYSRDVFGTLLLVSVGSSIYCLIQFNGGELFLTLASFLTMLFAACMTCHGELAQLRPAPRHLTWYYLMISIGGALGGLFVALWAPQLFRGFYELHWAMFAAVAATFLAMFGAGAWTALVRIGFLASSLFLAICFVAFFEPQYQSLFIENWGARLAFIAAYGLVTFCLLGWNDDLRRFRAGRGELNPPLRSRSAGLNWPWMLALGLELVAVGVGALNFPEPMVKFWRSGLLSFFPLLVIFALSFRVQFGLSRNWRGTCGLVFTLSISAILGVYLYQHAHKPDARVVDVRRDFYGLLKIKDLDSYYYLNGESVDEGKSRELVNGRILHGTQFLEPDLRMRITSYYGEGSGVGLAVSQHPNRLSHDRLAIGVVGLGTGTMAAWTAPQDKITFYEINPEVIDIAWKQFFYLSESAGEKEIIAGDARIQMERQVQRLAETAANRQDPPSGLYDVLVIDAFSSDAIPRHLLTAECFQLYRTLVKSDGILAVHVSNHYLDLRPITYSLAEEQNWTAKIVNHDPDDTGEPDRFLSASTWILVSNNTAFWNNPVVDQVAYVWPNPWRIHWTDDFGSLVQVLRAPRWLQQPDWWPWKEFWLKREQ